MSEQPPAESPIAFLRSIRSVRRFAPAPVPENVVHDILDVGRWTGSAKNTQPWEMIVVRARADLQQLATCGQFAGHLAGAAVAVAIVMRPNGSRFDAGRLAQNLTTVAWAHGVGSCIASIFPEANEARARELLGVPSAREMRTIISFGYPADRDAVHVRSTPEVASVLPMTGRQPLDKIAHDGRYGTPYTGAQQP